MRSDIVTGNSADMQPGDAKRCLDFLADDATVVAALATLLCRYTGQLRVEIERHAEGATTAFVADLADDPSLRVLAARLTSASHHGAGSNGAVAPLPPAPVRFEAHSPEYDVFLTVEREPSGTTLSVDAAFAGSDCAASQRLLGNLDVLLHNAARTPDIPMRALEILTEAERATMLVDWNATQAPYVDVPAHELFERSAARHPDRVAAVAGSETITYAELNERANRLAHQLIARGIGPEKAVGIALQRGVAMLVAVFAVLKAGGAYIPLDPSNPAQRQALILEDADLALLLTETSFADRFTAVGDRAILLDRLELDAQPADNPARSVAPENVAYIIYTSGTTGRPKGVVIEHRSVAAFLGWVRRAFDDGELGGVLFATSLAFDVSVFEIFGPLSFGGRLIIAENILALHDTPAKNEVTLIAGTASGFAGLLRAGTLPASVTTAMQAGERLHGATVDALYAQPGMRRVLNLCGGTEDTVYSVVYEVPRDAHENPPIGRPFDNHEVYLLDEHMHAVPIGMPGEIYYAGLGVAREYLKRPDLNEKSFVPNPFRTSVHRRLYRSGDIARFRADGNLEYLHRADTQIKLRGFRVELSEIEQVFMAHPEVAEAVVVAVPGASDDDARLAIYLVGRTALPSFGELRAFAADRLPPYMIPSAFVAMDELPQDANGKLDRKALPPAPFGIRDAAAEPVAPTTPLEIELAELWREFLGIETVGTQDDFFQLGGHSLMAARIVARVRDRYPSLTLRAFIEDRTIAALDRRAANAAATNGVVPALGLVSAAHNDWPLSYAQTDEWMRCRAAGDPASCNVAMAWSLGGSLDRAALAQALDDLAARHEQLRATVVPRDGEPRIRFADAVALPLRSEILARGRDELERAIAQEVSRPFDLEHGPLARAALFESKGDAPVLLLTAHGIIVDSWAQPLIARDLVELYAAARRNGVVQLPGLKYQYQEYAVAEREGGESGLYDAEAEYWADLLDGAAPIALNGAREAQAAGGRVARTLAPAQLNALRALARERNTTTFVLLGAAFAALLKRSTGHTDVVLGAPLPARQYPELEDLVGNFASLRPLRIDVSGNPSFAALADRVSDVVNDARQHHVTPFAVLRERLRARLPQANDVLFACGFRLREAAPALRSADVTFAPRPVAAEPSGFGVMLDATERHGGLEYALEYGPGTLGESAATALLDDFARLLAEALARPDVPLGALELPPPVTVTARTAAGGLAPGAREYPLSYAQEQLWFLDSVLEDRAVYNVPMAWRLHGAVDFDALQRALDGLIARHEQLRATFAMRDGAPVQRIADAATLPLRRETAADEAGLEHALKRHAHERFDLERGPLIRAVAFERAGSPPVLLLNMHHIVSDGWSVGVIAQDLAALYDAALRGEPPALPPLTMQYTDYALAERENEATGAYDEDFAYWTARLTDLAKLDLIGDRRPPARRTVSGGHVKRRITGGALAALRAFARDAKTTTYAALLAAFSALLARQSGEVDITVGSPVFGRSDPDLEPVVGYFISMLTMRVDASGDPTFRALAARAQEVAFDAFEHQRVPFTLLVEKLAPHRDELNSPLFNVVFVKQASVPASRGGAVSFELVSVPMDLAKFDLSLDATEEADELVCSFSYSHDKFSDEFAASLIDSFCRLVALAAASPDVPLGALPLVSPEREARLALPPAPLPAARPDVPVQARFADHVRRAPDAVAVIDGATKLSYAQLDAAADRLAHQLRDSGVVAGSFVGICMQRSAGVVTAILAILRCGAAYVPIDPQYPPERIAFIAQDAGVRVAVTDDVSAGLLPLDTTRIFPDARSARSGVAASNGSAVRVAPDDAAYVIYTSGSTGTPKGVVVTHRNVARLFDASQGLYDFGPDDVWTLFHSYAFDFSVWEIWGALAFGGTLVIVPPEIARSPVDFRALVAEQGVTVLNQTPSAFYEFVAADAADPTPLRLRYVVFGGEALDMRQLEPWFARHGETAPQLVNMYGITETTVHVTFRPLTRADAATALSPIGVPLPDLRVLLLDEHGNFAADGFPGEMYVAGDGVARGYLGRAELTAERFPELRGQRLYRSGDLARRRLDGEYEYIGRSDFQVKIRGFRIELGEIESVLAAQAAVERAIVLAERTTTGETRLVAFVIPAAGASLDDLRPNLAAKLPHYMIPAAIVPIQAIPLTTNGKIDQRALMSLPRTGGDVVASDEPMTQLQTRIKEIFCEFLKIDGIGLDESFFMRGGHSLLAARLAAHVERAIPGATARLRDADGKSRLLRLFYISPTVRALAALLEGDAVLDGGIPLVCMQQGDPDRPAVFWLHGMFNGDGLYAWDLVKALPDDVPFYVLHPHGYDGRPFPPDMMRLASEQLAWIRSVRPHGPYHLGGFCNGALIAFEIASRLVKEGEEVLSLTLVSIPQVLRFGPRLLKFSHRVADILDLNADQRSTLFLYMRSYTSRLARLLQSDSANRRRIVAVGLRKAQRKVSRILGRSAGEVVVVQGDFTDPYFKNNHYVRAISEYHPSYYPGTVDMVWGREMYPILPDPTNGWRASVAHARVHVLDGGHLSLASEHGDQIGALLGDLVGRQAARGVG